MHSVSSLSLDYKLKQPETLLEWMCHDYSVCSQTNHTATIVGSSNNILVSSRCVPVLRDLEVVFGLKTFNTLGPKKYMTLVGYSASVDRITILGFDMIETGVGYIKNTYFDRIHDRLGGYVCDICHENNGTFLDIQMSTGYIKLYYDIQEICLLLIPLHQIDIFQTLDTHMPAQHGCIIQSHNEITKNILVDLQKGISQ